MKRLTRKSNREYYETHIRSVDDNYTYEQFLQDRPYTLHHIYCVEYETKLGRLEDLEEEELGCPLEVFIKIMLGKIKEIVVNYEDACGYEPLYEELTTAYVSGIVDSYEHPDCLCLDTNLCDVPVKDYHKNWWLKGEKNEN